MRSLPGSVDPRGTNELPFGGQTLKIDQQRSSERRQVDRADLTDIMQDELQELRNAFNRFTQSIAEALSDFVELVLWFLYSVETLRLKVSKTVNEKTTPWILLAVVSAIALFGFFASQRQSNPNVQPSPFVGPFQPHCPDCVPVRKADGSFSYQAGCPRCVELETKLKSVEWSLKTERVAMRRELMRTQLNVQQLQTRNNIQPMKLPEWFYYSEVTIGDDGGKSMKWDSPPTPDPDSIQAPPPAGK